MQPFPLVDAPSDLSRDSLGDLRLDRRAQFISRALQARPSESFPKALADQGNRILTGQARYGG